MSAFMVVLSGANDVVDGFIARHFNMISNFGKAFDPIADKLTQFVIMICLTTRIPYMLFPVILLTIKEVFAGIIALIQIKRTKKIIGADWHGKVTTILIYSMIVLHIIWYNMPAVASSIMVLVCTVMMLLSAVLYGIRNIKLLLGKK